jgi:hypothetical protein
MINHTLERKTPAEHAWELANELRRNDAIQEVDFRKRDWIGFSDHEITMAGLRIIEKKIREIIASMQPATAP